MKRTDINFDFGRGLTPAFEYENGAVIAKSAVIGNYAKIGNHAVIGNDAVIGNHAKIGNDAVIGNHAKIGNDAVIGNDAKIETPASVLSVLVTARSGDYVLTLYVDKCGPAFTWGCRAGDDLKTYLLTASPEYPAETCEYLLALWHAFVKRNN